MTANEQQTFAGAGGLELHFSCWRPRGVAPAVIAVVHGIGEHSGRYTTLVSHLTVSGFAVCGFDHRGHGNSPGKRGHIVSWSDYREDVRAFLRRVREQFPNRPVFLYGHSLGALVASEFVLTHPYGLSGLIVSGIPLQPTGVAKPHLVAMARVLSRVLPSLSVSLGVDGGRLSRDEEVVREYDEDPLVHHVASMRWGAEAFSAIDRVRLKAAEIRLPILILHGGADRINSVEGSKELFDKVSSSDKELKVYPGGEHEPHNDLDRNQVVRDVEAWIVRHMTPVASAGESPDAG